MSPQLAFAEMLEERAVLDARCLQCAHTFVRDLGAAELAFSKAVKDASSALFAVLTSMEFGKCDSRRRRALVALNKMASTLADEMCAHGTELRRDATEALATIITDADSRTDRLTVAREARQRTERTLQEACDHAEAEERRITAVASVAPPSALATDKATMCPWLAVLRCD